MRNGAAIVAAVVILLCNGCISGGHSATAGSVARDREGAGNPANEVGGRARHAIDQ